MSPDGREVTLETLLEFVKRTRGFDFTGYKRSTIERRIAKRMGELGLKSYEEYVDHLELDPDEFSVLFNTILINVTGFFRDAPTWEHLASDIVPQLVASRPPDAPLRAWCAGVASGEEAYTVAMVFASVLGESAFLDRVKIYATDVDEEALDQARQGTYAARLVEDVPPDALERFFERAGHRYTFRRDLRRTVIFGRNDLVQDAPISRIDLLVCRNTLMYFNAETQDRILRRFHFALDDDGVLLLGKSEMLITHADLFRPVDLKRRIFHKVGRPTMRDRVRVMATDLAGSASLSVSETLRAGAYDATAGGQIVIDSEGALVMANEHARRMLGLAPTDIGRPIRDLEVSFRPVELRSALQRIAEDRQPITVEAANGRTPSGRERLLDVRMTPVVSEDKLLGVAVSYADVTDLHGLRGELVESKRDLQEAHEQLQSTVEELETTNEELQSTNEELETTNEELQSTNEELETMNEELQSTNEEIETVNQELQQRSDDLNRVNGFLESILGSIRSGLVVVDDNLTVQTWNAMAENLWGLRSEEVRGKGLLSLEIGLPAQELRQPIRACMSGEATIQEVTLDSTNRRGKPIRCRVTCTPMMADGAIRGAILLMEDETARRANEATG
jgi:two-component system, chemotaxis family, CheB/CheR fusion protein